MGVRIAHIVRKLHEESSRRYISKADFERRFRSLEDIVQGVAEGCKVAHGAANSELDTLQDEMKPPLDTNEERLPAVSEFRQDLRPTPETLLSVHTDRSQLNMNDSTSTAYTLGQRMASRAEVIQPSLSFAGQPVASAVVAQHDVVPGAGANTPSVADESSPPHEENHCYA